MDPVEIESHNLVEMPDDIFVTVTVTLPDENLLDSP